MKELPDPTHGCPECDFTTIALSKKGIKLAVDRHYRATGHAKLIRLQRNEDPQELNF
jgi:hypothetical protein